MKVGDLVKWTLSWVVIRRDEALWDNVDYSKQVGVLEREWEYGWYVTWSNGETRRVHKDYLEAL